MTSTTQPDSLSPLVPTNSEELFRLHFDSVCATAFGVVRQREDAQDITMEGFYRLLERFEKVSPPCRLGYWRKTTFHLGIDRVRRQKHPAAPRLSTDALNWHDEALAPLREQLPDDTPPFHCELEKGQLREGVREAVARLPDPQRDPLLLFYFGEQDIGSIAKRLSLPTGTVKSRLSRARDKLASPLAELAL